MFSKIWYLMVFIFLSLIVYILLFMYIKKNNEDMLVLGDL